MVVSCLERNQAGLSLRRVMDKNLVSINLIERNTGGKGNFRTQLVSLKDALQLVMVLPGDMAKAVRVQISEVMTDFFKGDESLVDQIRANAASDSPICQLARADEPTPEDLEARRKRIKRDELEMMRMQVEIEERRANTMRNLQETQEMRMRGIEYSMQLLDRLNPTWQKSDARFRMQTEDMVKNILTVPVTTASLLTNGEPSKQQATLSISQLAQELGCKKLLNSQLSSVGSRAARLFRTRYGKEPTKHRQWCDGAERDINTYTEADRPLLTQVFVDMGLVPGSASSVASSDE
jgi:hypothetical protein